MDRRLLFPVITITAWAQQPSKPATEALRDRVQQYYQLTVEQKYRQAEALVAESARDDYYNGSKPTFKSFEIVSIDLLTDTTARVTLRAKVLAIIPMATQQIFSMPVNTYWKLENGLWYWYTPEDLKGVTPFGKLKTTPTNSSAPKSAEINQQGAAPGSLSNPDVGALLNQITLDRSEVTLSAKDPEQVVTITNGLPGPIDLVISPRAEQIKGIKVAVSALKLSAGQKSTIRITRTSAQKVSDEIVFTADPFPQTFRIQVRSE